MHTHITAVVRRERIGRGRERAAGPGPGRRSALLAVALVVTAAGCRSAPLTPGSRGGPAPAAYPALALAPPTPAPGPEAAPTEGAAAEPAAIPDGGGVGDKPTGPSAPELGAGPWINSDRLRVADLRGRVVLVEFWTFGCINCQRTLPAMKALDARYDDVVIVGVHTPELQRERDEGNVRDAVARAQIGYPVVMDNDYATWRAFGNAYWPALYVVDKHGVIRDQRIGEIHEGTASWDQLLATIDELRQES